MKKIGLLYITLFALLVEGCVRITKEEVPVLVLDKSLLQTAKTLCVDTIGIFDEFIYAQRFRVYRDSILIVQNKRHTDGYFVEFCNLHTNKKIAALYKLGNGPEEMLSAWVEMNGDTLYVNDFIKGQLAIVNLDSLLKDSTYKALPVRHLVSGGLLTSVPYNDGFLLENPNHFVDEDLGINQNAPRFIVTDGKTPYVEKRRYEYYTRNVAVDGCIITNYSKDRIVYAYMGKSVLEIYNRNLNLRQVVKGPVDLKAKYTIGGDYCEPNEIHYNGSVPYAYLNYYADNDFIYLSYAGDYMLRGMGMKDLPGWIFKFNWDGALIGCYQVGSNVRAISKCGNVLYVTVLNKEDVPILLKMYEDEV